MRTPKKVDISHLTSLSSSSDSESELLSGIGLHTSNTKPKKRKKIKLENTKPTESPSTSKTHKLKKKNKKKEFLKGLCSDEELVHAMLANVQQLDKEQSSEELYLSQEVQHVDAPRKQRPSKKSKKEKIHGSTSTSEIDSPSNDRSTIDEAKLPKAKSPHRKRKVHRQQVLQTDQSVDDAMQESPLTAENVGLKQRRSISDYEDADTPQSEMPVQALPPLRYQPDDFQEILHSQSKPWLEDVTKKHKELWLIKIPHGTDPSMIENQSVTMDMRNIISEEHTENEQMSTVWELEATKTLSSSMSVLLPSKKDKLLHSAGKIAAQVTLIKGVKVPPCVMPQTGLQLPPKIPSGLKLRHKPFGADTPFRKVKMENEETVPVKKKKKAKKQKLDESQELKISPHKKKLKKEKKEKR